MKIVIFGVTGMAGQRIAKEALSRGHEIVGVVRDPEKVESPDLRISFIKGDATDAASVASIIRGADAVVSAVSPRPNARGLAAPSLTDVAHALINGATAAGVTRLVVVGGAGSLEVSPGVLVLDSPNFPAEWKPEASAHRDALAVYRAEAGTLDWTFLSPAAVITPGERTGHYRTGGDQILFDAAGMSYISAEDFAVALVDELENAKHVGERFTVAY